jgi:hypothetical protein
MSDQLAITNTVNTNNGHLLYRIAEAPDQLALFQQKQWRDVWRTRAEVEAHLERRESF